MKRADFESPADRRMLRFAAHRRYIFIKLQILDFGNSLGTGQPIKMTLEEHYSTHGEPK
jgi:hypothetical protein